MFRRGSDGTCTKCGGKMVTLMESESNSNGFKYVKYVSRCRSCNDVNVIEELIIRKQGRYTEIILKR